MTLAEQLQRFISPLKERVLSMIGCAIIQAVKDSGNLQVLKLSMLRDELKEDVERIQEYGFTSNPPKGSEAVVVFPQGNREFGVVIATDSATYRLKNLPEGAVALYNKNGDYVKLTEGKIEVHAAEITLGDGSDFKKLVNEEFQDKFNNHFHLVKTAGSAAAQTGISSSPAAAAGTAPLRVAAVAPDPATFLMNDDLTDSMMTSKSKAE